MRKTADYYKNNPIEYIELVMGVKLLPFQKVLLEKMLDQTHSRKIICYPYRHGRTMMIKALEIAKNHNNLTKTFSKGDNENENC